MPIRDYERQCKQCNTWFVLTSNKKQFCTSNCRIAHKRGTKGTREKIIEALNDEDLMSELGYIVTKIELDEAHE